MCLIGVRAKLCRSGSSLRMPGLEACEERSDGELSVGVDRSDELLKVIKNVSDVSNLHCFQLSAQIKLRTKTTPTSPKPDDKLRASKATVLSDLSPQEIPRKHRSCCGR